VLYMDMYIGGGIKFPSIEYSQSPHPDQGDYNVFSIGYKGIYPMVGVRLGIGL
jgi:hypothetical protein